MKVWVFIAILVGGLLAASLVLPVRAEALGSFCGTSQYTDSPEVDTALGCIPVRVDQFMTWLLPYIFGIAGGISFLLMVYGFILMSTSGGDPKAVQGARETVTSAITGLLVSIFALFILRLLAVNILHIPGIN
jgi:hypothetical protein